MCDLSVLFHTYVAYHIPNWLVTPKACNTHLPPNTFCRSPGELPYKWLHNTSSGRWQYHDYSRFISNAMIIAMEFFTYCSLEFFAKIVTYNYALFPSV